MVARQHQVLGNRHRRHQREVLIDHAQPERMSNARVVDIALAPAHHDLAGIGLVITHDAFHERALAGAVFAEQGMKRAGRNLQRHVVERGEIAEALAHGDRLDAKRHRLCGLLAHAIAAINAFELETVPNTPPCILIILMAWS